MNRILQGLGERLGFVGLTVVTVAAAMVGWCHRGDAAEVRTR